MVLLPPYKHSAQQLALGVLLPPYKHPAQQLALGVLLSPYKHPVVQTSRQAMELVGYCNGNQSW